MRLSAVFICIAIFCANIVFATDECSVFVNIYNDETDTFAIENTELFLPVGSTITDTLDALMNKKLILGYKIEENRVAQIDFLDKTSLRNSKNNTNLSIHTKVNGETISEQNLDRELLSGDIVEWIYGEKPIPVSSTTEDIDVSPSDKTKPVESVEWKKEYQVVVSDACEYLALNKEATTSYLIAMGAAGRTLDVKMINDLLGQIRRSASYPSKTDLAKTVISMTFAGYDASELVSALSDYKNDNDNPVLEAIYVLLAYDCAEYEVSADSYNARRTLVNTIIKAQNKNGAFVENSKTGMDKVQLTAMAITALSNYQSQIKAKKAILAGVEFLANEQTQKGTFLLNGEPSTTLISKVIIGLCSAKIGVLDERFIKNEMNMVDSLTKLQNIDGGFMENEGEKSSPVVTEQAVIALSAAKKNNYPYKISHSLTQMNKTPAEKLIQETMNIPLEIIFLASVAISISLFAIVSSFICKHIKNKKIRNNINSHK